MKVMNGILAAALVTIFAGAVHAQDLSVEKVVPADEMTCDQAVAYYQKNKRIYKRVVGGNNVVPIYGMTPVGDWRKLTCDGRGKSRKSYYLPTRDKKDCVIAVYCG